MSEAKALCAACGLSQFEAARFLGVRVDTVKSWWSGRRNPPDGALDDLADLQERIERYASLATSTGTLSDLSETVGPDMDGPNLVVRGIALARRRRALR